jgi:hypothetical protein
LAPFDLPTYKRGLTLRDKPAPAASSPTASPSAAPDIQTGAAARPALASTSAATQRTLNPPRVDTPSTLVAQQQLAVQ